MLLSNNLEIPNIALGPGLYSWYVSLKSCHGIPRWDLFARAWNKYYVIPNYRKSYVSSIAQAIKIGYRLIDFSTSYGDGSLIREAISSSGISRNEIFLTGRISNKAQYGGKSSVKKEIERILNEFGTDYIDILMFHWPVTGCFEETWKVICDAYDRGIARSIGVANCHLHHIEQLQKSGLTPMVNQIEIHPLFNQADILKPMQDMGIVIEAYTAIARNDDRLMRLPRLLNIANKYKKTPVQIVLAWHLYRSCIPVIRTFSLKNQRDNLEAMDVRLRKEDVEIIDSFNINSRLRYDPDNCDFSIL